MSPNPSELEYSQSPNLPGLSDKGPIVLWRKEKVRKRRETRRDEEELTRSTSIAYRWFDPRDCFL